MVGSFEEAIDCWRNDARRFPNDNDGVILAATSGAVNVRLGGGTLSAVPLTDPLSRAQAGDSLRRGAAPTAAARRGASPSRRTCAAWSAWSGARS